MTAVSGFLMRARMLPIVHQKPSAWCTTGRNSKFMNRCQGGPICVVYPEAVWYTYVDQNDIDEIVESHLKNGKVVERLLTPPHLGR